MDYWPTNRKDLEMITRNHRSINYRKDNPKKLRTLTNLFMSWIDFNKAYSIAPHSLILKILNMLSTVGNITTLINNNMTNWETVLTSGVIELG